MTKQDILNRFKDINYVYNNCMTHQILSDMLDELLEEKAVKPVVNQDEWVCGCCGTWLERQRMIHPSAILHNLCEYCPQCGKKVDWKAVDPDADEG